MKKMNNRGFVISTVLYTLVIMIFLIVILLMSLMAASRRNSKNLIDTIEDELNRYSETKTDLVYDDDQDEQVYIVPYGQAGWYYIQLWGASGGNFGDYHGGYGGYTSGLVYLAENTHVTFYIGRAGSSSPGESYVKANTGGAGTAGKGAGGGGATTMQIDGTNIMIAAGGGGASAKEDGGPAGGIKGGDASLSTVTGGTQSKHGIYLGGEADNSSKGGSGSAGGGSGLYGGGAGYGTQAGAGGSSYIIGYAATNDTNPKFNVLNPLMIVGTNQGNGRVSIELMTQTEPVAKTDALNNVRYIKTCDANQAHSEIQVISTTGQNIAYEKASGVATKVLTDGDFTKTYKLTECVTIDLGSKRNDIAEIAVWHKYAELYEIRTSNHHFQVLLSKRKSVSVSSDGSSWTYLKLSQEKEVPEDSTGLRFSRYQNTTVKYSSDDDKGEVTNLPAGNYYIISALGKNQALEAKSNYDDGTGSAETRFNSTVQLSTFTGNANQRWTIEKVDDGYRIVEADSHHAMQVVDSLSQAGSRVNTSSAYGSDYGWTKWKINSLGDGTYNIYPVVQKDATKPTYLATSTEKFYDKDASTMQLSYKNETAYSQRFYLININ